VTVVRPATPEDIADLVVLFEEMDRFYGAEAFDPEEVRREQIRSVLFGDVPMAYALLAYDAGEAVGFASYSFLWPAAGLTSSLYLKELYVSESRQRQGAGGALMAALIEIARKQGCSRVEWTTDRDNAGAQAFYDAAGHAVNDGKLFYRHEL